jgi:hypothetical protein
MWAFLLQAEFERWSANEYLDILQFGFHLVLLIKLGPISHVLSEDFSGAINRSFLKTLQNEGLSRAMRI